MLGVRKDIEDQIFLLTPLREGRHCRKLHKADDSIYFYSRPCGRGDQQAPVHGAVRLHFYSRPCGRGDYSAAGKEIPTIGFLLTPLREGRRNQVQKTMDGDAHFYSRPCGRGDRRIPAKKEETLDFYSRPCGRGDVQNVRRFRGRGFISTHAPAGGATCSLRRNRRIHRPHFYSRPCGRGDGETGGRNQQPGNQFLLTPLREGRPAGPKKLQFRRTHFYSRPCGRGDIPELIEKYGLTQFLLTPLREGRRQFSTSPS